MFAAIRWDSRIDILAARAMMFRQPVLAAFCCEG